MNEISTYPSLHTHHFLKMFYTLLTIPIKLKSSNLSFQMGVATVSMCMWLR